MRLRHELHRHPELSCRESGTKARLMSFIKENTDLIVVDCGKWFYATNEENIKPAVSASADLAPIAFRADMDALAIPETIPLPYASENPGVSHKCGHDGHMAALCGLALAIGGEDRIACSRPVYLIFQHGEEIGAGGRECSTLLLKKQVKEVYAFHNLNGFPMGSIVMRPDLTQPASEGLTISFTGRRAHASEPEKGISPAAAVAELVKFAKMLEDIFTEETTEEAVELLEKDIEEPEPMRLCTVVHAEIGTKDFGIAAGEGEVSVTLRAERESDVNAMEEALLRKAGDLAGRDQLKVTRSVSDYFSETRNDDLCLDKVKKAAKKRNFPCIEMKEIWRASEDFGYYTKVCPGAIFYVGTGENHAPLHTPEYDFPDEILEPAVEMFETLINL